MDATHATTVTSSVVVRRGGASFSDHATGASTHAKTVLMISVAATGTKVMVAASSTMATAIVRGSGSYIAVVGMPGVGAADRCGGS